jgi:hypothetical protein
VATKTFTQAQLTASDVNTFALKGDTCIASVPITAGQIVNCFGGDYENYKIVISNFFATADCYLWLQLGYNGGTIWIGGTYYQGGAYQAYSTGTITTYSNNGALPYWQLCAGGTAATGFPNSAYVNIQVPRLNTRPAYSAQSTLHFSAGIYSWYHMGNLATAQAADSMRWATTAGAVSSGTVSVYGVMQA